VTTNTRRLHIGSVKFKVIRQVSPLAFYQLLLAVTVTVLHTQMHSFKMSEPVLVYR